MVLADWKGQYKKEIATKFRAVWLMLGGSWLKASSLKRINDAKTEPISS